mgnify:FL=1
MSITRNAVYESGLQRRSLPGDNPAVGFVAAPLTTVGAGAITAAMLVAGNLRRTGPTGAYTDTLPTAEQICAALRGFSSLGEFTPGMGFVFRHINTVAYAATIAVPASSGISLSTSVFSTVTANAASQWRDYFIELGSAPVPAKQFSARTINGSKRIIFDAALPAGSIVNGMSVYGTGVGASAKVSNMIYGASGIAEVLVDVNSTADGSSINISFTPTIIVHSVGAGDL